MGMGLLSAIRDADWLTFQRVRAYALMLGVAAFALLAMAWIAGATALRMVSGVIPCCSL